MIINKIVYYSIRYVSWITAAYAVPTVDSSDIQLFLNKIKTNHLNPAFEENAIDNGNPAFDENATDDWKPAFDEISPLTLDNYLGERVKSITEVMKSLEGGKKYAHLVEETELPLIVYLLKYANLTILNQLKTGEYESFETDTKDLSSISKDYNASGEVGHSIEVYNVIVAVQISLNTRMINLRSKEATTETIERLWTYQTIFIHLNTSIVPILKSKNIVTVVLPDNLQTSESAWSRRSLQERYNTLAAHTSAINRDRSSPETIEGFYPLVQIVSWELLSLLSTYGIPGMPPHVAVAAVWDKYDLVKFCDYLGGSMQPGDEEIFKHLLYNIGKHLFSIARNEYESQFFNTLMGLAKALHDVAAGGYTPQPVSENIWL